MERTSGLESAVRAWAERQGCAVRVLNDGHHWLFQNAGFMAEWCPNSARLAVNRDYDSDINADAFANGWEGRLAEASMAGCFLLGGIRIPGGKTHRRAQPLRTGARNAKNACKSATPGGSPDGLTPICGVLWLAQFPIPPSITQAHPNAQMKPEPHHSCSSEFICGSFLHGDA